MMKIMVKNLQAPDIGFCDINEWARDFGSDGDWFKKIVNSILDENDLELSDGKYTLTVDTRNKTIELVAQCDIPGISLRFIDIALQYMILE